MRRQVGACQRLTANHCDRYSSPFNMYTASQPCGPARSDPCIESVRSPRRRAITNTVIASSHGCSDGDPWNGVSTGQVTNGAPPLKAQYRSDTSHLSSPRTVKTYDERILQMYDPG
jgi:hypothetical protein